ncbi:MAG: response regulator transcription factor [Pseudomonadota bacterium]
MKTKLLLVEDDERLAQLISSYLENEGFTIIHDNAGDKVEQLLQQHTPQLVLLDLNLPKGDGIDICRRLRVNSDVAIIILTAKGSDIEQVVGLEVGADDYIAKPVEPVVLLARIKSLLRRIQKKSHSDPQTSESNEGVLVCGQLKIDELSQSVFYKENKVTLTSQEYELLLILVKNAGKVLSRDHIFQHLRGFEYDGMDRTVDVKISRLRKKFDDNPIDPEKIKTIWGKGYLLVKDAWQDV